MRPSRPAAAIAGGGDKPEEQQLAAALNRRLDQLREREWMLPLLRAAIERLVERPVTVDDFGVEYCKTRPRREINAALDVSFRRSPDETPERRFFSCTLFPTAARGRTRFEAETREPLSDTVRHRLEKEGFARGQAFLADPALIVRAFPVDPVLRPGIEAVTDVERMRALFRQSLASGEWKHREPTALRYDILHYKPLRSCTLRYEVTLTDTRGTSEPATWCAYGKLYRDDRGPRCYELLRRSWEAARASGGRWRAAEPLALVPEWRFMLQAAVPGRQFRRRFGDLADAGDDPGRDAGEPVGDAALAVVRGHLRAIARAIRSYQTSGIRLGPRNDFSSLMARQERRVAHLVRSHPRVAAEIAALRARLSELEPLTGTGPFLFSHGDLAHGNVLVGERGEVGVIDFDDGCQCEPAYDVAYFLAHIWTMGARHPRWGGHLAPLCEEFRRAYLEDAPDVPRARLALYEALTLCDYVLRNFSKQSFQGAWLAGNGREHLRLARERLDEAGGEACSRSSSTRRSQPRNEP